jgi:hypothetical protein
MEFMAINIQIFYATLEKIVAVDQFSQSGFLLDIFLLQNCQGLQAGRNTGASASTGEGL